MGFTPQSFTVKLRTGDGETVMRALRVRHRDLRYESVIPKLRRGRANRRIVMRKTPTSK